MVSAPSVRLAGNCVVVVLQLSLSLLFIKGPAGVLVTSFEPCNCIELCRAA